MRLYFSFVWAAFRAGRSFVEQRLFQERGLDAGDIVTILRLSLFDVIPIQKIIEKRISASWGLLKFRLSK